MRNINLELAELEARHKAHQHMLEEHKEAKHRRRERHKQGWYKIKPTAQTLP